MIASEGTSSAAAAAAASRAADRRPRAAASHADRKRCGNFTGISSAATGLTCNRGVIRSGRIPRPGTAALLFTCLFAVQAAFSRSRRSSRSSPGSSRLDGGRWPAPQRVRARRARGQRSSRSHSAGPSASGASSPGGLAAPHHRGAAQLGGSQLRRAGGRPGARRFGSPSCWPAAWPRPRSGPPRSTGRACVAWTLLGQPGAWVAGMPIIGLVGGCSIGGSPSRPVHRGRPRP
jgi:hypothetical protein